MDRRLELDERLKAICPNVYFQPPETVRLTYPCIIYSLSKLDPLFANNLPYHIDSAYTVQYITRDPDDRVRYELAELQLCRFERHYTADNLNHYIYRLYY